MKKLLLILCAFPLLMAATCEDEDDIIDPIDNCSEEAVAGLNVTVIDGSSDGILSDGVTVIAVDGAYSETLELINGVDPSFSGAWENPGTYLITVSKDGYVTTTSNPVTVTADACHVIPQNVTIEIIPE